MRLADLDPKWIRRAGRVVGVRFTCPCCRSTSVAVLFSNPPDGGAAHPPDESAPGDNAGRRWSRSGETFDDLTLTPSIDVSSSGHWHGFVTNGAIT